MIIQELPILDISKENIPKEKVNLANQIIKVISPIFDIEFNNKTESVNKLKEEFTKRKNIINSKKEKLEKIIIKYNRKKKEQQLLSRLSKLVSTGIVVKDPSIKRDTSFILKKLDTLSDEKIDFYITETVKILSKRLSKSIETNPPNK